MKTSKQNLSDQVYYTLKNRILRGELPLGTAFKEEALSNMFKVSRTPLRKALTQLMSEGYLKKYPDRTLRIPEISYDDLVSTFAARKLLEVASVRLATANATEQDIIRLEYLIADEKEANRQRDTVLVSSLDRTFHEYLAKISRNNIYFDFIQQLSSKVACFLALTKTLGDVVPFALQEHDNILSAIQSHDTDKAGRMMLLHLDNVESRMLQSIRIKQ